MTSAMGDWLPFAEDGSGDMLCVELETGALVNMSVVTKMRNSLIRSKAGLLTFMPS